MRRQGAQVLVFFALALPLILLPVAAYAVDASVTASTYSRLLEVTARAAEEAAQQIDVGAFRSGGGIAIDALAASQLARSIVAGSEPQARVTTVSVVGQAIRVLTSETVVLPFNFLGTPSVDLHARAEARIAAGYDSPNSSADPRVEATALNVQRPAGSGSPGDGRSRRWLPPSHAAGRSIRGR